VSSPPLAEGQPKAPTSQLRSAAPKLVVSLLIAVGFVWVFKTGGVPIVPERAALSQVEAWSVAAFAGCYVLSLILRPYRWLHLVRPIAPAISAVRVFSVGLVGFTAVFFAPLRTGELVRPWLLADKGEITFLQATGTVAAERIFDGLVLTLMLVTCLMTSEPLADLPDHLGKLALPVGAVPRAATLTCLMFAGALLLITLFYRWRKFARSLVFTTVGRISPRLADWLSLRVERLSDGFKFLPSRSTGVFLRDTLAYWLLTLVATWSLLQGVGLDASLAEAGVVLGVMGIGTLVPSGPGFFGTYQLGAYLGLAMFFPEERVFGAGAVFAFVSYCVHLVLIPLSGLAGAMLLSRAKRASAGSP
jgi:hypothetical protein